MKNENIPAEIKSKSLKEARHEIDEILNKLEDKDVDLASSMSDYQRLIQLNKHIDFQCLLTLMVQIFAWKTIQGLIN